MTSAERRSGVRGLSKMSTPNEIIDAHLDKQHLALATLPAQASALLAIAEAVGSTMCVETPKEVREAYERYVEASRLRATKEAGT